MKLEEVYYFAVKKQQHPPVFDLAQKIVDISGQNLQDEAEIQRRMSLLTRTKDAEHIRQCSNFLAEVGAFDHLVNQGINPHWVPESTLRMPDLEYDEGEAKTPVEVKHLNSPREEHEALSSGKTYGGSVDKSYHLGLQKKIADFIEDAKLKFVSFNKQFNGIENEAGTLYLFFSKSIDAGLLDGIEWEQNMEERVTAIAQPLVGSTIKLIVMDIDFLVR